MEKSIVTPSWRTAARAWVMYEIFPRTMLLPKSELLELFLSDHAVFPCRHYSWTWFDGHGCAIAMTIASRETNCGPKESWPYFSDFRAHLSNDLFVVRCIEDR